MIITKEFIWFHVGKTGGDMFHYLMNKYYKEHIIFQHDIEDLDKHVTIPPREYKHIKKYVMGFRRLPSFIISHNRHQLRYECKNMSYEEAVEHTKNNRLVFKGFFSSPDSFLKEYVRSDMIDRTNFIRQEYLLEDFTKITGNYMGENKIIIEEEKETIKNSNMETQQITLTHEEKNFLYKSNPFWSNIESVLYQGE
jgi:hypothetical protein